MQTLMISAVLRNMHHVNELQDIFTLRIRIDLVTDVNRASEHVTDLQPEDSLPL